jgi:hypothetical protein
MELGSRGSGWGVGAVHVGLSVGAVDGAGVSGRVGSSIGGGVGAGVEWVRELGLVSFSVSVRE